MRRIQNQVTDTDPRFFFIGFQDAKKLFLVYIFLLLTVHILGIYTSFLNFINILTVSVADPHLGIPPNLKIECDIRIRIRSESVTRSAILLTEPLAIINYKENFSFLFYKENFSFLFFLESRRWKEQDPDPSPYKQ